MQEDWHNLTVEQRQREFVLKEKEKELIARREELERERHKIWGEVSEIFLFWFFILFFYFS